MNNLGRSSAVVAPRGFPFEGWACPICAAVEVPDSETPCLPCGTEQALAEFGEIINISRHSPQQRKRSPAANEGREIRGCLPRPPSREASHTAPSGPALIFTSMVGWSGWRGTIGKGFAVRIELSRRLS